MTTTAALPEAEVAAGEDSPAASLTSRAYARLRSDIITGALAPGTKLKVQHLTEIYGSGASPIREALSMLSADNLVERIENRGFRVSDVSRREFVELLDVRSWVEERALRRSIAEGGREWEDAVVTSRFRLAKAAGGGDSPSDEWEMRHKRFHMALIGGAGPGVATRICDQLYDRNVRYRHIAGRIAYPHRRVEEEHDAIAEAALSRDADEAVSLLLAHYGRTADYLLEALP